MDFCSVHAPFKQGAHTCPDRFRQVSWMLFIYKVENVVCVENVV